MEEFPGSPSIVTADEVSAFSSDYPRVIPRGVDGIVDCASIKNEAVHGIYMRLMMHCFRVRGRLIREGLRRAG